MIVPSDIDSSWKPFFTKEVEHLTGKIEKMLVTENPEEITPVPERMLRFLKLDLSKVRVVIIGQDPYPQKGVATGRAFEVGHLRSWSESFRNTSLRNIVRAIYAAAKGEIKTFNEIKQEIVGGAFSILPPNELFKFWEAQGVLLLNTSFSCRVGKPGSHSRYWKPFTDQLLEFVNMQRPDLTWFLWGNHAKKAVEHIKLKNAISTTHPMICHARPDDFLFGGINVFKSTEKLVDWQGETKKASSAQMQKRLW